MHFSDVVFFFRHSCVVWVVLFIVVRLLYETGTEKKIEAGMREGGGGYSESFFYR